MAEPSRFPDVMTFTAAVLRDLLHLIPRSEGPEFPQVIQPPSPSIATGESWIHVYEEQRGHIDGAHDQYERAAAERIVQEWDEWSRDRQAQWSSLLAPAAWSPGDLELWAAWWRSLPREDQAAWEGHLAQDPGWWQRVVTAEETWWQVANDGQAKWLQALLEQGRGRRRRGFLGRLQPPDGAWQGWIEGEAGRRQGTMEAAWQEHVDSIAAGVARNALAEAWRDAVRAEMDRQLRELAALPGAQEDYRYWNGRLPGAGIELETWLEFQEAWRRAGETTAAQLLAQGDVRQRLCAALRAVSYDPAAAARTLASVLYGLSAAPREAEVPLVAAALAAKVAHHGPEGLCS